MIKNALVAGGLFLWMTLPVFAGEGQDGKAIYQKLCASCHGADGKGNPAMAKAFGEKALNIATKETAQKGDDELLKVITQGRGKMPASGKGLSKQEQKQVLEHMRSFAK
ncbi:MAG TPA: cytochrome c [Candidatus Acidoferrales bacterium]|nr:cytochrome c [Candidatus Acidoferrales bacterium]